MNTSNDLLYDPLQLCKAVCENNDKTFRELFKGKINGSFLVKKRRDFKKVRNGLS
mgnify:CR=1 FL=1